MVTEIKIAKYDQRFFGNEPDVTEESTKTDLIMVYNWYNYVCSNEDAKKFVLDYLYDKRAHKLIAVVDQIDPLDLRHVGWNLRIKLRGGILPKDIETKTLDTLDELIKKQLAKKKKKIILDRPVVSIQERINTKVQEIIGDFESELDKFALDGTTEFNPETYIKTNDIKPLISKRVSAYYECLANEIEEAIKGKDEDLKEAYRGWKKTKLKKFLELIRSIIEAGQQVKKRKKSKNVKRNGTSPSISKRKNRS